MWTNSICRSIHQARKCRLVSSGPLSPRIASGCPRSATIPSNTRVTLRLSNLVSTSKAKHSRVYACIHHAQHPDPPPTLHRIVQEVQRPLLVRCRPRLQRRSCPNTVFALLSLDHQPRLSIHPMHALVIHVFSTSSQQHVQPSIPEARLL